MITHEPLHSADEILHEHVPRQPLNPVGFQGHRSKVKGQGHFLLMDQSLLDM